MSMGMKGVSVVFHGQEHAMDVDVTSTSCNEFLQLLVAALHKANLQLAVHTLKLLVPKKGILQLDKQPHMPLSDAGIAAGMRLLLVGSLVSELSAMQAAQQAELGLRMPSFEHEAARAALRGRPTPGKLPDGRHFFGDFKVLPAHPLAPPSAPGPSAALRLLHQLAADPAISAVMESHGWRVGLLSEMPPEGKVGVSAVCVLGYNVNRGQEISLRLRTDDLRGFRKYLRIRETLVHELAHMEWNDHDSNFKALNSQLLKEVAQHEAVSAAGTRRLVDSGVMALDISSSWLGDDDAAAAPAAPRPLVDRSSADAAGGGGAASALHHLYDARSAAAVAAITRWQQAPQSEQAGVVGSSSAAAAVAADESGAGVVGSDGAEVDMAGGYDEDPATAAAELHMTRLGSFEDTGEQQQQQQRQQQQQWQEVLACDGVPHDQSGKHSKLASDIWQQQQAHQQQQGHVELEPQQQRSQAIAQVEQCQGLGPELLLDVQQQQQQPHPPPPQQQQQEQQEKEGLQQAAAVAHEDDVVVQKLSQARHLVQQLLQQAADSNLPQQPGEALQAVAAVLNNLAGDFHNPRYRRIRISNPAFQRKVLHYPAAMQLLVLAGFSEQNLVWQAPQQQQQQQSQQHQQLERVLVYIRDDPGLLWLVLSAVHGPLSLAQGNQVP